MTKPVDKATTEEAFNLLSTEAKGKLAEKLLLFTFFCARILLI